MTSIQRFILVCHNILLHVSGNKSFNLRRTEKESGLTFQGGGSIIKTTTIKYVKTLLLFLFS